MNYRPIIILFLIFHITTPGLLIAQIYGKLHSRSLVTKTEKWKPGRIDDIRQVLDSFFYEDGILKEVDESIIKRKHFRVIDSIPINKREVWSKDGKLILTEKFKKGKVIKINSNFPHNENIIFNGSFETHTQIPRHKITREYIRKIRCNPIDSIIRRDTVHIQSIKDEITKFILVTKETTSGCDNGYSRMVLKFVLIEKNQHIIDSIFIRMPYLRHKGDYSMSKHHDCNYETVLIKVNGWRNLGSGYPNIYDFEKKAPQHPLTGLADSVFYFKPIAGNSFIKLTTFQWAFPTCNLRKHHPLLQNTLATTLEKGKKYHLEFWLWKAQVYPENKHLQVYFSQEPVTINNYKNYFQDAFSLQAFNDRTIHQWQKIILTFEAPEFARYMTIGFFDFEKDNIPAPSKDIIDRWCYVDGFVLVEEPYKDNALPNFYPDSVPESTDFTIKDTIIPLTPLVFDEKVIEKNQPVILKNVNFHKDDYTLTENSIPQLQKLVRLMKSNPQINIKITGHTDNNGSAQYNQTLSEKRALSVVNYLKENGISLDRLSWQGNGDTHPISDNDSEKGKALNRRVEFLIENINRQ